jgi:tRNA-dihydrouridine synthase
MRMGWDSNSLNFLELANLAAENGAKALALHGRTGKISYQKPAQWQPIAELKRAFPQLPVIGNGDVVTPADARRMLEETGCDAVMIGRAAKTNPWIFSWRDREEVSIQEVAETALWQLKDMLGTDPESTIMPFRKYLKAYLDPYKLPRETMRALLTCGDPGELITLVNQTFINLGATIQ